MFKRLFELYVAYIKQSNTSVKIIITDYYIKLQINLFNIYIFYQLTSSVAPPPFITVRNWSDASIRCEILFPTSLVQLLRDICFETRTSPPIHLYYLRDNKDLEAREEIVDDDALNACLHNVCNWDPFTNIVPEILFHFPQSTDSSSSLGKEASKLSPSMAVRIYNILARPFIIVHHWDDVPSSLKIPFPTCLVQCLRDICTRKQTSPPIHLYYLQDAKVLEAREEIVDDGGLSVCLEKVSSWNPWTNPMMPEIWFHFAEESSFSPDEAPKLICPSEVARLDNISIRPPFITVRNWSDASNFFEIPFPTSLLECLCDICIREHSIPPIHLYYLGDSKVLEARVEIVDDDGLHACLNNISTWNPLTNPILPEIFFHFPQSSGCCSFPGEEEEVSKLIPSTIAVMQTTTSDPPPSSIAGEAGFIAAVLQRDMNKCVFCEDGRNVGAAHLVRYKRPHTYSTDDMFPFRRHGYTNLEIIPDVAEGITLCSQCHQQFDNNYIGVQPDTLTVEVSAELRDDRKWSSIHGKVLEPRSTVEPWPSKETFGEKYTAFTAAAHTRRENEEEVARPGKRAALSD